MNQRLLEIDVIKTFSIILILMHHFDAYTNYDIFLPFKPYLGVFGLGLFVFISGYALTFNNRVLLSCDEIILFYKKRIIRIFPLYLLTIFIFFLVFQEIGKVITHDYMWWMIQAFGLDVIISPNITPIFTLWFISMLIIYYLIYPIIVFKTNNVRIIFYKSSILFFLFLFIKVCFGLFDIRFFVYYFVFISGIIFSYNEKLNIEKSIKSISLLLISFIIFFLLHFISGKYSIYEGTNNLGELLSTPLIEGINYIVLLNIIMISFSILLTLFLKLLINPIIITKKQLFCSMTIFCATASYCVYLFHRPYLISVYYFILLSGINPILGDVVVYLSVPILFILSFYIQKKADKIIFIAKSNLLHEKYFSAKY